jgi:hypothetical protein
MPDRDVFSEPIDLTTLTGTTIRLQRGTTEVAGRCRLPTRKD